MKAIPKALKALSFFVALPRECGSRRGLRGKLHQVRIHYHDLRWQLKHSTGLQVAWLFARWVRRWQRSQGRYNAGSWCAPNTVWELRKALREFDPHTEVVMGDQKSGFAGVLVAPDAAPAGRNALALVPARFP